MARKAQHSWALQFDEHLIAALRFKPTDKGFEAQEFVFERGVWAGGGLGDALKAFSARHDLHRGLVYSVLPRHDVTARILTLPTHDTAEMAGMVRFSAEEYVPYSASELVIDQRMVKRLPGGEALVLAVFAHEDVVNRHLELLRGAGIEPERILLSTACLASAAVTAAPDSEEPQAFVNLSSGGLEALMIRGPALEYARAIAGPQDWAAAEPDKQAVIAQELAAELRASIAAHRRESPDGLSAGRVYLSSDWFDVRDLCEPFSRESGHSVTPALDLPVLARWKCQNVPLALAGAALTAAGRAPFAIELEPASLRDRRRLLQARATLARWAVLVALLIGGLLALYLQAVLQRRAYIGELEAQLNGIRPAAREVIEKQRQLGILQRQVDRSGSALEALATVTRLAQESTLNINNFRYSRGDEVTIQGRALVVEIPYQFAGQLRELGAQIFPPFARANVIETKDEAERQKTVWRYKIQAPLIEEEIAAENGPAYDETAEEADF